MTAVRALLGGIVDYAGLFPPAALDMRTAVANYARYRGEDESWMLGRFVAPVGRLDEFSRVRATVAADSLGTWPLTALLGSDVIADVAHARAFNDANQGRAAIDSLEAKITTSDDVERLGEAAGRTFQVYAEVPLDVDLAMLIDAVKRARINAKVRTGGVTADAIPSPAAVVRFIRACVTAGVAFKATAGLHHPLRAEYRLTYAADAPTGVMFGYLNVFLAAAFISRGMSDSDAITLLDERDGSAFVIDDDGIRWRDRFLSAAQARDVRRHVAVSFGSCSFREPVDELRSLAHA